jgi:hypothetical protein
MALTFSTVERREVKPVAIAAQADKRSIFRRDRDAARPFPMLRGNSVDSIMRNFALSLVVTRLLIGCEPKSRLDLGQGIAIRHHHRRGDQHSDREIHLMARCSGNAAPFAAREAHRLAAKHLHGLLDTKPD